MIGASCCAVSSAIVRQDTRMFDDPLQFYQPRRVGGLIIAVLVCLGAALLAYFKPLGKRGGDTLLVDRSTNQLYVVMPGTGQLRPVYNLTSARLVLGNPGTPVAVKSDELNKMPKGQPIGIPGAPYTPVSGVAQSMWTRATGRETRKRRAHGGDVGDRAAVGGRRLGRSDAPRPGRAGVVQGKRLAGDQRWQAFHRPRRPRRNVGGGNPGDREGDSDFRGLVQRTAERGALAVAGGARGPRILACRELVMAGSRR
jgi:type VII secretion protein EccB